MATCPVLAEQGIQTEVIFKVRVMATKTVKVQQIKSSHGLLANHKACLTGLGLRRIRHVVELQDTPAVRGMISKVRHLVQVQE